MLTRALEISPENEFARSFLGVETLLEGRPKDALRLAGNPTTPERKAILVMAEHDLGHDKDSQQALDDLIAQHRATNAYLIAQVYGWRKEPDMAFEWLDRAFAQNDLNVIGLTYSPTLASLRGDPRYAALVKRLNLPVPGK